MAHWSSSSRTSRRLITPDYTDAVRAPGQITVVREMRRKREAEALVCSNADPAQDQEAQSTLRQSFDGQGEQNGSQKPQMLVQQSDGENSKIRRTSSTGEEGSEEVKKTLLQNAGSSGTGSRMMHKSVQRKAWSAIRHPSAENGNQVMQKTLQQNSQSALQQSDLENGNQVPHKSLHQKSQSALHEADIDSGTTQVAPTTLHQNSQPALHKPNVRKGSELLQKPLEQKPLAALHQTNVENETEVPQENTLQQKSPSAIHQFDVDDEDQVPQENLHQKSQSALRTDVQNGDQVPQKTLEQKSQSALLQTDVENGNQVPRTTLQQKPQLMTSHQSTIAENGSPGAQNPLQQKPQSALEQSSIDTGNAQVPQKTLQQDPEPQHVSSRQVSHVQNILQQKPQTPTIHQFNGENESWSQLQLPQTTFQQKPSAIHQMNGENVSSDHFLQKILQQKLQRSASGIHEGNGENGSSRQLLRKILQHELQTSAINQTNGENWSWSQVLQKTLQQKPQLLQKILQQIPHAPTSAMHQRSGESGSSRQGLQKPQTSSIHRSNGENGNSNQMLQKILQQIPHTSAIHRSNGENGSLSQVLQQTLETFDSAIHNDQPHGENGSSSSQVQQKPQMLATYQCYGQNGSLSQLLPQSATLQNYGENGNQVLQTIFQPGDDGGNIHQCEAIFQQLHIGSDHQEDFRPSTLRERDDDQREQSTTQHFDCGKSSHLLESILQQPWPSSVDGYQRETTQLAYNGCGSGHSPHIGDFHQDLARIPQQYSMQYGSQAIHPIIQQSQLGNEALKSQEFFQVHQTGSFYPSNLKKAVYQNGDRNDSQQACMKLTDHGGDDKLNPRPSVLTEDYIQSVQRMGQWIITRDFSADRLSQGTSSTFVGPKQEPVDGAEIEGAESDHVNPCFSLGLVNSVPVPTQMGNSLLSRVPRNVWWKPPISSADGQTSGESAPAQQSTATFNQSGYLPIAGLVTPISAPMPQMPYQHAPSFTSTQVNAYGASPHSQLGSSLTPAMDSQWVDPSLRTQADTSPYITADLVSRMSSRSPHGPVKTRFNDKSRRSLQMQQLQQHPGPVTAVDFFKPTTSPSTYFSNNVAAMEASWSTIASSEPVHEAVPLATAAAIPLQNINAQSLNLPPRPVTLQEALQLQFSPLATAFPSQNSSSQFPTPLPPLLQSVTPASIQAAALGLSWPRASPIVPKLEHSLTHDIYTNHGAAVVNALPTAYTSLINSESFRPPFPAQSLPTSSNLNDHERFPQVSHTDRVQFPPKRSQRRKEDCEPDVVACTQIQGGVRATNLDSQDQQKGLKRVRFDCGDEHHGQRKQRQQVGMVSSGATETFESQDLLLQRQIVDEWRMVRRVTRKKRDRRNVEHKQSDQTQLPIRRRNGFNHERFQHDRKQRKKWKLLRRNGTIYRGIEELLKSARREAKVTVANNQFDKEWRKLSQRRDWQLGEVGENNEGGDEQKRHWMLTRVRLLQTLILWKKARYRARLLTHPLFPHLLKAHVDCIRVMTPACKLRDITLQLQRAQRFFEKFLRFAPTRPQPDDRRFDLFLRKFLGHMKNFQNHLECQIKLHATPTYSRLWRIERALFQMTGTRIPGRLESGPLMTDELEEENDADSVDIMRETTARINYANIKRVIHARYYGAYGPTAPDRAIMETIRTDMVDSLGLAQYKRKIKEVREEILRKRRAGKLPEGTTNILRSWWEAHAKWPYPTEDEKELLIKKTGLELKQVNNWFINQRKRNWHNNPLATSNRDKRKYPLPAADLVQL